MKPLVICAMLLAITGCNPVDYIADKSAKECEAVFDAKFPEIMAQIKGEVWDMCTGFYEDVILPSLSEQLDEETQTLIQLLEQKFQEKIAEAEADIMTRFGCVEDPFNSSGWDCNGTFICE